MFLQSVGSGMETKPPLKFNWEQDRTLNVLWWYWWSNGMYFLNLCWSLLALRKALQGHCLSLPATVERAFESTWTWHAIWHPWKVMRSWQRHRVAIRQLPFGKTRYSFPFVAAAHVKSAYSANATVTCHAVKCSGMHVQIYAITFLKGLSTKIRRLGEVQENFGLRLNYWRHCNMHPGLTW